MSTETVASIVLCADLVIVGLSRLACAYAADVGQLLMFRAAGGAGSTSSQSRRN